MTNPLDRVAFWSYDRAWTKPSHLRVLRNARVVIAYFPATCDDLVRDLQRRGVLVLGYVSFYKAPVIAQVQPARSKSSCFEGGAHHVEEAQASTFWSSIAIDPDEEAHASTSRVAHNDEKKWARPFSKQDYPAGWYRVCPLARTTKARAVAAVEALARTRLDGVFIDNVIGPGACTNPFCAGPEDVAQKAYVELLTAVHAALKRARGEHRVWLNAGKEFFLNHAVPADCYVRENLCYADTDGAETDGLRFMGKLPRRPTAKDQTNLVDDLNVVRRRVARETGASVLGLTKVSRKLGTDAIRERLAWSREVASQASWSWTTRLAPVPGHGDTPWGSS